MGNLIQGIIACALSILLWLYSGKYVNTKYDLLGPSFFPRMTAVLAFICGLMLVIRWFRKRKDIVDSVPWLAYLKVVAPVVAIITVCLLLMKPLGFLPMSVIFLFSISAFLGNRDYKFLAVYSVSMSVVLYVLFNVLLKIGLPEGVLYYIF